MAFQPRSTQCFSPAQWAAASWFVKAGCSTDPQRVAASEAENYEDWQEKTTGLNI